MSGGGGGCHSALQAGLSGATGYVLAAASSDPLTAQQQQQQEPLRLQAPRVVAAQHSLLSAELVRTLRSGGKQVFSWTVDAPGEIRRALALGADALVTNVPREAAAQLQHARARAATCSTVPLHMAEA